MSTATQSLPLDQTVTPSSPDELAAIVRDAHDRRAAVYPLGGGTSLDFGLPATRPGLGLATTGLARVIDYPARDMTVTVEAGITLQALAELLAGERQWLPIEAPAPGEATLGGLLATNFSGPRRLGWGTARDYVIGITAVDGRGVTFKAGGRVVKNVAGYDFCKLLIGSLGTLAVITQVTLKLKPLPEASRFVTRCVDSWDEAERLLASFTTSPVQPAAVELLAGPAWDGDPRLPPQPRSAIARVLVALEGSAVEVDWMTEQLRAAWQEQGRHAVDIVEAQHTPSLWQSLTEFPAAEAPLVLKLTCVPSAATELAALLRAADSQASIQAHAGSGVIIGRMSGFTTAAVTSELVRKIQPAASARQGSATVLSSRGLGDLTRQAVWGLAPPSLPMMAQLKRQFDPRDILNPGRFLY